MLYTNTLTHKLEHAIYWTDMSNAEKSMYYFKYFI